MQGEDFSVGNAFVRLPEVNKVAVVAVAVYQFAVVTHEVTQFIVQPHFHHEGRTYVSICELADFTHRYALRVKDGQIEIPSPFALASGLGLRPFLVNECRAALIIALEFMKSLEHSMHGEHTVEFTMDGMLAPMDVWLLGEVIDQAVNGGFEDVFHGSMRIHVYLFLQKNIHFCLYGTITW
ncbi:MAG: hypothetical protein D3908_14450 [Candidatus Electrothrix sp. AUS4]|nr:hypothetical protein [Candidatus Electrothrix sp. AUS4]